ncbi:MAG: DNA recombination protein RmuC [candidate division Zixibacteria bacterium]|nr:DNA recombination protein RmuC [candidate division Zixibacteria bacterium]
MLVWFLACFLGGLLFGGLIAWLIAAERTRKGFTQQLEDSHRAASEAEGKVVALEASLSQQLSQEEKRSAKAAEDFDKLREKLSNEERSRVRAETELKENVQRLNEERALLEKAQTELSDAFKALAASSLSDNNESFLKLARTTFEKILADAKGDLGQRQEAIDGLIRPIGASLKLFEEHVRNLETNRQQAYTSLEEHLKSLTGTQQQLQKETGNLVTALRTPHVRGRWGEMTLRRVVELAGMSEHCDFVEQVTVTGEGARLRPDLIVHLPSDRDIVVDAKVSLDAYLTATTAETEDQREELMIKHAQQVRAHMNGLSIKAYWDNLAKTPEFVVMFIPGESFFAEAAHHDTSLIEDGMQMKVVPATPTTLITLLKAVAYGWRQEQIAKSATEISDLGKQLYERMRVLINHVNDIGEGLQKANNAYSAATASIERRVLPAARRFKDLGVQVNEEIPIVAIVETTPRRIIAPEGDQIEGEA